MQPISFVPSINNKMNNVALHPNVMYAHNQNVAVVQNYQENIQQYHQPIFFEPLPPIYVKNQLLPSPILMQMPTTVVVQNESQPSVVFNQPPSNIVVKNNPPTSVFVKQSNPNVVVKNEAPPNYIQGFESCQETIATDSNQPMFSSIHKSMI
ncbi:conserved protein, unknown function [Hepatocystis sp. ex Piliocolobus tephrosceles]|nr:conserved protein, unknown function [Hepatocystis sp. ex Piliocolobus tephrosceles]